MVVRVGCLEARARMDPEVWLDCRVGPVGCQAGMVAQGLVECPGRGELVELPVQPPRPAGTEPAAGWVRGLVGALEQGWGARVELPAPRAREPGLDPMEGEPQGMVPQGPPAPCRRWMGHRRHPV